MAARARWRQRLVGLALGAALVACAARAEAACTVSIVAGVSFGAYDVFSSNPLDSAGQFTWRCSRNSQATVRITLTKGASPTYRPRTLVSGANRLPYYLYLDSARSSIWGDETEGTVAYYATYPGSGRVAVSVFGRVQAGQDAAVGVYSDSITVVVNF